MSTEAQNAANKANAQHSTGPKTEEGKAHSSQNNFRHGFAGQFSFLPTDDVQAFEDLYRGLHREYQASTLTEELLVQKMAQHHWLAQRAIRFQMTAFHTGTRDKDIERSVALYLRYQIANERGFSKCLSDLLKLKESKKKEEIGFESQRRAKQDYARKEAVETRKQEMHKMTVWLAEAKAEHQELLNHRLETPEMRNPNRMERVRSRTQAA